MSGSRSTARRRVVPARSSRWAATLSCDAENRSRPRTRPARPGPQPACWPGWPHATSSIVTHGNGPQVGLLALMSDAYTDTAPYPLDVLGSETEGQIGYVLELALEQRHTRIRRRSRCSRASSSMRDDPAFSAPSKFIGPVYTESRGTLTGRAPGWTVKPDGDDWRRVVPSPRATANRPARRDRASRRRRLSRGLHGRRRDPGRRGSHWPSAGRGGRDRQGPRLRAAGERLRRRTRSCWRPTWTPSTTDYGTPRRSGRSRMRRPPGLRSQRVRARVDGSEGRGGVPLRRAHRRRAERSGASNEIDELLSGRAGTQVLPDGPELKYGERNGPP